MRMAPDRVRHRSNSPSGGSITNAPGSFETTKTIGDERAALEHQEIVGRVRLDRHDTPELAAGPVAHLGADHLVHPELAVGAPFDGIAEEDQVAQGFGAFAIDDAFEAHDPAILMRSRRHDRQFTVTCEQH